MLPDQGSNLNSSDPESDVLPITPSGNEGAKVQNDVKRQRTFRQFFLTTEKCNYLPLCFAQLSLSGTVRLKTKVPGLLSLSTQKYPIR